MARRRIGQERLAVGGLERRGGTSLDEVATLVDWAALDGLLAGISASAKGEPGWPPLALFRALLLATWHDLSDMRLAEALDDRASFRRFCGFAEHEPTPERTAFVRFRAELVHRGLDRALFEAITRQLDSRGVVVRAGTLVDATLIESASIQHDPEARWAGHRRRKPVHGYKAHVATDQEAGLIRGVEVTTDPPPLKRSALKYGFEPEEDRAGIAGTARGAAPPADAQHGVVRSDCRLSTISAMTFSIYIEGHGRRGAMCDVLVRRCCTDDL
jgi:IS5 family transposase